MADLRALDDWALPIGIRTKNTLRLLPRLAVVGVSESWNTWNGFAGWFNALYNAGWVDGGHCHTFVFPSDASGSDGRGRERKSEIESYIVTPARPRCMNMAVARIKLAILRSFSGAMLSIIVQHEWYTDFPSLLPQNIVFSIFQFELEAQRGDVKRRGVIGADVSIALLVTLLAGRGPAICI